MAAITYNFCSHRPYDMIEDLQYQHETAVSQKLYIFICAAKTCEQHV